jgi:hypothetical protein
MASITRTHGTAHPQGSSGAISADAKLVFNGVEMDFFKIIIKDVSGNVEDLRGELDANEGVVTIMQEIGKKANVEMYQVEGDTTGVISVALYPTGAFTATTLQTAIRTLTAAGTNSLDCTSSEVTNPGFELV